MSLLGSFVNSKILYETASEILKRFINLDNIRNCAADTLP